MSTWIPESGLKDDFVLRVDSSVFEERDELGGNLCLILAGTDLTDPTFQPTLIYNCGPGWETADGGTAVHQRNKTFNAQTKMGKLMTAMGTVLGVERLEALGEATDAKTYVNLVMHIVAEQHAYSFMRDGESFAGTTRDQLPTEIWQDEGAYLAATGAPAKLSTGSTKADAVRRRVAEKKGSVGAAVPIMARLDSFAKTSDSFETFIEKALELDEVANDDELVEMVSEESASGFYATHSK